LTVEVGFKENTFHVSDKGIYQVYKYVVLQHFCGQYCCWGMCIGFYLTFMWPYIVLNFL